MDRTVDAGSSGKPASTPVSGFYQIGSEKYLNMQYLKVPREEAVRSIPVGLILTFLTCGLYDLYWNAKQMKAFNGLLGRDEFSFWHWLFLSALTCGIFHLYYEYRMGIGLVEIQEKYGMRVDKNLPLISLLLSIFGFSIVVDAIQQYEINKLYEKHHL